MTADAVHQGVAKSDNKKTDNYLIFTYNLTSYFFFWIIKTHWLDFHKYFNKKKFC